MTLNCNFNARSFALTDTADLVKFKLGQNYLQHYKYKLALAVFKNLTLKKPDNPSYLSYQGICYYKMVEYDKAIGALKQAIKLKSNSQIAHEYLCYAYSGKYNDKYLIYGLNDTNHELLRKSIDQAKILVNLSPNSIKARILLASIASIQNFDLNLAIKCYKQIIKLKPGDAKYTNSLAYYLALNHNYNSALKYYNLSLKIRPHDPFTLAKIAYLYKLKHNCEEFNKYRKSAIESAEKNKYCDKSLAYIKNSLLSHL